ncbi:hypothetical protein ACHAWF_018085 [Thalassiosira exigua]
MTSRGRKRVAVGESAGAGTRSSARLRGESAQALPDPEPKKPDSERRASNVNDIDSPKDEVARVKPTGDEASDADDANLEENYTISDEDLFGETPRKECEICNVRMGWDSSNANYQLCCGKEICNGCLHSMIQSGIKSFRKDALREKALKHSDCPYCGVPCFDTDAEAIERLDKLLEKDPNDGHALHFLAFQYANGNMGLPQDMELANDLWIKAGTELGFVDALNSLANSLYLPRGGFERNREMAHYYYQLAAMKGHMQARYNAGVYEEESGSMERAVKHYVISAKGGFDPAESKLRQLSMSGHVSKEELDDALAGYKKYQDEVLTDDRRSANRSFQEEEKRSSRVLVIQPPSVLSRMTV